MRQVYRNRNVLFVELYLAMTQLLEHLSNLVERIQHYFPEQKDPRRGDEWIRNPFAPTVNVEELNISVDLKDKLLELSADEGLQNSFESNSLASF